MEKYFIAFSFTFVMDDAPGIPIEKSTSEIFNIEMPDSIEDLKRIIMKDYKRFYKYGIMNGSRVFLITEVTSINKL